jgi:hypothetical protein
MTIINHNDWNPVQSQINSVVGTPDGTTTNLGYNGGISSAQKNANDVITGSDWNNLRSDINKAYYLQTGANSDLTTRGSTYLVTQADLTQITARSQTAYNNRLTINNGSLNYQAYNGLVGNSNWGSQSYCTVTFNWGSNARFRGFWNGGGYIALSGSRTGGGGNPSQDNGWTNLLSNCGQIILTRTSLYQSGGGWAAYATLGLTGGMYGGGWSTGFTQAYLNYDRDAGYTGNYFQINMSVDNTNMLSATSMQINMICADPHIASGTNAQTGRSQLTGANSWTTVASGSTGYGPDYVDGTLTLSTNCYYPFSNNPTCTVAAAGQS